MKASDRGILLILPIVALIAAFWLLVLSPKREEASQLGDDVAQLESEVAAAQQLADAAEQAREEFPDDYRKVVTLGKAVPQDDDTPSLLAQLSGISAQSGVEFMSLELQSEAQEAAAPAPSVTGETPSVQEPPPGESEQSESAQASTPAPATESSAAALPLGAAVGPAGLPTMPYTLKFRGSPLHSHARVARDFFHVADFIHGVDKGVSADGEKVSVDGRLITIDGFTLKGDPDRGFPFLEATFAVTTYLTPETQGLTAGATPSGPAPVAAPGSGEVTTQPTSSTGVAP